MLKIIGICGYARSGKDEAAKALIETGWTRLAFADELKLELCRTFGMSKEFLEQNKEAWRPLLVEWGRGRRRIYPAYWIEKLAIARALLPRVS